jgi:hypothetical protein
MLISNQYKKQKKIVKNAGKTKNRCGCRRYFEAE